MERMIPDLILTSDWHLRQDTPVCRKDNFVNSQWDKVDYIASLQVKYGCPVIHAGDLFEFWKPTPHLLTRTIKHLPKVFWTIYGNHDLPQHNIDLAYKCGIDTLEASKALTILSGVHFGQIPIPEDVLIIKGRKVLVWHIMTYTAKPWPGCTDPIANKLLRMNPEYDLIITGDNHQSFYTEEDGRLLVNPGSLTRQDADQINHKPSVYFWYASSNTIERILLPFKDGVISREHLEVKQQRDDRINAFISGLSGDWSKGTSFENNMEEFEKANKVSKEVMAIVYKAIGYDLSIETT